MKDTAFLIITQRYNKNPDMSPEELYEAARGDWNIQPDKRETLRYAVAAANRDVKAVYRITGWNSAGELWKFTGELAEKDILDKCINRQIARSYGGSRSYGNLEEFMNEHGGFASEVQREHVLQALDYSAQNGTAGNFDILFVYSPADYVAVLHDEKRFSVNETIQIAYCYAIGEQPADKNKFTKEQLRLLRGTTRTPHNTITAEKRLKDLGFDTHRFNSTESGDNMKSKTLKLLRQFYQIILHGPPGTGKTYTAKEILAVLFGADKWESMQGEQWDIVQFHPSYNYEDFVRGVQIQTENKQVEYKTVNRTFGEICKRASEDAENEYALIIDEINRANVSAVLGELIYALEYRGKAVKTPYLGDIIIPKNLYIIGTMNTADRTIGQIDYAVRRRFAFVHCPPEKSVVEKTKPDALLLEIYDKVRALFHGENKKISPDFDAADVEIGHSYFLADEEKDIPHNQQIANKIIWQVVPILHEYVKDGVLQESAESAIKEIEDNAKKLQAGESEEIDSSVENEKEGRQYFYWEKDGKRQFNGIGRTAFGAIKHFIGQNKNKSAEELRIAFGMESWGWGGHGENYFTLSDKIQRDNYFPQEIANSNGEKFRVSNRWWATAEDSARFNIFKEKMSQHGYTIGQCHIVNLGEDGTPASRIWEICHKYGFIVAGGDKHYQTDMKNLKKNDFIFIRLAEQDKHQPPKPNRAIACGIIADDAVPIKDFRTDDGRLLADIDIGNGQTYRQRREHNFNSEYPDWAVRVKWIGDPLPQDKVVKISRPPRKSRLGKIAAGDFNKLCETFNLNNKADLE